MGVSQLFPAYVFVLIVSGWRNARWSPGVVRLVMDGLVPARVPDAVITEIRSRERNGFVELPKSRGLAPGTRVRVISGPLSEQIGLLAVLRPHERAAALARWAATRRAREEQKALSTLGQHSRADCSIGDLARDHRDGGAELNRTLRGWANHFEVGAAIEAVE